MHTLTGWIPERVSIRPNDPSFNKEALFSILESRMSKGDALVTVATGDLPDSEADRTGLVSTHAYAVLDVRTVNGVSYKNFETLFIVNVNLGTIIKTQKPLVASKMAWKLFRTRFAPLDAGTTIVTQLRPKQRRSV